MKEETSAGTGRIISTYGDLKSQEAGQLAAAITSQLATNRANPDAWPRRC